MSISHLKGFKSGTEVEALEKEIDNPVLSNPEVIEDVLSRSEIIHDEDSCWEFKGAKHPRGYGQKRFEYEFYYTHRLLWAYAHGCDDPRKIWYPIHHKCDNPACLRPDHLTIVTHSMNILERFTHLDPVKRQIRRLYFDGFSLQEIADAIDHEIGKKAVWYHVNEMGLND